MLLVVNEGWLEVIPLLDAITLSLKGKRVTRIILRELEEVGMGKRYRENLGY